jgi:hypothetical protein
MVSSVHIPAIAAFSGSAAGMLATVLSNWAVQYRRHRIDRRVQAASHRHRLYKRFIREASKFYADALVGGGSEISNMVNIYVLIAQVRVVSGEEVIAKAERAGRLILDIHLSPNRRYRSAAPVFSSGERPRPLVPASS